MQKTQTEYTIVKGAGYHDELENYRLCFQKNGTERTMNNLQWLHNRNLSHINMIWYAMRDGKIAGVLTGIPVIMRVDGSFFPALQAIDSLIDIDHRGKGLFLKLATQLNQDVNNSGFLLIYGFPNENSAHGFFTKLEWTSFGEAPFLIKPFSVSYFLKKLLNRKKHTDFSSSNHIFNAPIVEQVNNNNVIRKLDLFDNAYNEVWEKALKSIHVCVDRSSAYMNWRYVDKPEEYYYRYGLYNNDKLEGIIVFTIKKKHNGLIGYIMELVFDPENKQAGKWLLKFASRQFRKQKVDVVLAWCIRGSFNYPSFKKCGYYKLPEKLRPQKLFVGGRVFDQSKKPLVMDFNNWYISYSDSDTA